MGLFGKKSERGVPSFPKAANDLGIGSEQELRERANILLNDTDGILKADPFYQMKIQAYKTGKAMDELDTRSVANAQIDVVCFSGHIEGANNISFCYNLSEINFKKMQELAGKTSLFSIKLMFFPTQNTPHMVAKVAINDGTVNSAGGISSLNSDVNFDMSTLFNRVVVYELIVFPLVNIHFIDAKFKGEDNFQVTTWQFENSFNVRTSFLREAEALMNSLNSFSVFSHEGKAVAAEYQKSFDLDGNAISPEAKKYYLERQKYSPKPSNPDAWTKFYV